MERSFTLSHTVLIAEDDHDIIELLSLYLNIEGYDMVTTDNGMDAWEMIQSQKVDIAIVDIMMPKLNGYDLVRRIREQYNFPIIILSAKDLDQDKILGLNIGADVYMTKPFNPLEMIAYVKALLRRYHKLGGETHMEASEMPCIKMGELALDLYQMTLKKRGEEIALTPTELKIMRKLLQSPGRVFTKGQLYECIGGELYESDENTMMVHISKLRSKIEDDPSKPKYIKTVRGLGYKIEKI